MRINKYAILIDGDEGKKDIAELILLIVKFRVPRNNISLYDIHADKGMTAYLSSKNVKCPVLFLWGNYYGDVEFVKQQIEEGIFQLILMNNPNKKNKKKNKKGSVKKDQFDFNPPVLEEYVQDKEDTETQKDQQNGSKLKNIQNLDRTQNVENLNEICDEKVEEKNTQIESPLVENVEKPEKSESTSENSQSPTTKEALLPEGESVSPNVPQEKSPVEHKSPLSSSIRPTNEKSLEDTLLKLSGSYYGKEEEVPTDMIIIEDYENQQKNEKGVLEESEMVELNVPEAYTLTFGDRWLNVFEWVLRGFVDYSKTVGEKPNEKLEKRDGDIDFYVMRTNWYGRHQIRIFRLTETKFYRLDEACLVREVFEYENVDEIICVDDEHVVIKFKKDTTPQYIDCKVMKEFLTTLLSHLTNKPKITKLN
ncbi:hypothetical protein EIN_146390 [Entamoeba invadens IP1]|uniref:Uncharacterized protein n=1 Tax=Entamoeba invadens IP1 TaxID=370355 RepID=L7FM10_ENTIV|nr:hypothetical protein EIN_146390 [Entamoeba invadens IP1]ELP87635.1 hypothetical protein EIN_146390 [Entamoeba invadens IP1]|eukprot:XP_004254406.1 hypothetical protein EIN_146390 [Entamoeba invadens IP1]